MLLVQTSVLVRRFVLASSLSSGRLKLGHRSCIGVPFMACIEYRNFLIVANPENDSNTGGWKPLVCVSWMDDEHRRHVHFFNIPSRYATSAAAIDGGLEQAKSFVDRRINIYPKFAGN